MLKGFVLKAVGKHMFARPRAILAVPSAVNEMERRSLISTMFDAGMRRTQLLNRSLAAALGAGLPIDEAYGTMIVDISAGVTDIAVLSFGKVIVSDCIKVGGDRFDDAIIRHLRRKHNLLIGERTAEELKINIGSGHSPVGAALYGGDRPQSDHRSAQDHAHHQRRCDRGAWTIRSSS